MKNAQVYILLAIALLFVWFMTRMNKTLNLQTSLLIGMANKLGIKPVEQEETPRAIKQIEETPEQKAQREEDELVDNMVAISDEIKKGGKLSVSEQKYYTDNFPDMHEDLNLAPTSDIILQEASTDNNGSEKKKMSPEEKHALVLYLFSDEKPKQLNTIAQLFADRTGLKFNKGNTHGLLKDMIELNKIVAYKKGDNVFYVLPEWMDKKKLKKEYLKNIA